MSAKGCLEIFWSSLDLKLFAKIKKELVSAHSQKQGLSITKNLSKV